MSARKRPQKIDNWKYRRRVVFGSLVYIATMVVYIVWRGADSSLYRDISVALIGAGVAIIGSYVFGAVWDDRDIRRNSRRPPPSMNGEDTL